MISRFPSENVKNLELATYMKNERFDTALQPKRIRQLLQDLRSMLPSTTRKTEEHNVELSPTNLITSARAGGLRVTGGQLLGASANASTNAHTCESPILGRRSEVAAVDRRSRRVLTLQVGLPFLSRTSLPKRTPDVCT